MLGGIIGGIGSAIMGGISMANQKKTNEQNRAREDQIRKEIWKREDNAVQRRAKDLGLAGINPLLAAGDPAQASTGGAVGQDQAINSSELQGTLSGTGQWADQMAYQKKMQILQENKQDAEIEKNRS